MKIMAFDVGGTEIKYGVIDDELNITEKGYVPTPMDNFESFTAVVSDIYRKYGQGTEGIAMSLPGFIDSENGYARSGGALRYNAHKAIGPILQEACGCPVYLENDGKSAAIAEFEAGVLKGCTNAAVFIIGTGVGGGLIINKQLVKGVDFTAGEFSFLLTDINDPCSDQSMMGYRCATTGLMKMYQEAKGLEEPLNGRQFFALLEQDEVAQKVLKEFSRNVAVQLYNLYFLLDLEKVAIGGGISQQPILVEKIRESFNELLEGSIISKYKIMDCNMQIETCKYHNDANMIGAVMAFRKAYGK